MINCINCKHCLKKLYEIDNVRCAKITCKNSNSMYYDKTAITSEEFPVNIYSTDNKCAFGEEDKKNIIEPKIMHSKGSIVIDCARDRFINLLNSSNSETFEEIMTEYIHRYGYSIPADACCQIINLLSDIQYSKIANLNNIKRVSKEHATYLKLFLEGKMYTDNDDFNKYKDIQKENAQAIIDICNE